MHKDRVEACLRIFEEWHERAKGRDVGRLLELYREDAELESPLVPAIMGTGSGVLRGKAEIRAFLEEGTKRRPNELVRWHRTGEFLCDGRTLFWEYPRGTPDGEQIDIAEVMEVEDGLILRHRIYWGWFGTRQLISSAVRKTGPSGG